MAEVFLVGFEVHDSDFIVLFSLVLENLRIDCMRTPKNIAFKT